MEIAMVLAIASLIVAGVMSFFGTATVNQKTEETLQEMVLIQGVVHSIYAGQPSYAGLTQAVVASSAQMPSKWVSGTSVVGALGPVNVVVDVANPAQFDITISGMPRAACQKLVTSDFGPTLARVILGYSFAMGGPIPVATAQASCTDGSGFNIATWIFN